MEEDMIMKRFSTVVTMVLVLVTLLSFCVFACAEETVDLIWWTYSDSGDAPTALKDVLSAQTPSARRR